MTRDDISRCSGNRRMFSKSSRLPNTLLAATLLLGSSMGHAGEVGEPPLPVADYDFVGWLGDALGNGPHLTKTGDGDIAFTTVDVGGSDRTALAVPEGTGLRLSVGPLLARDHYSVAMILSLSHTSGYAKLLDTNDRQRDYGLYAHSNNLRYYVMGQASTGSFMPDTLLQIVVTRDSAGVYTGYLDGVQQFSFSDSGNGEATEISAAGVLHFLRDDISTSGSEESDAVLHRIRLFDQVLSTDQVQALESNRNALISIFRAGGFEDAP